MLYANIGALVADDDPISRGIVAEQLMRLGVGSVRSASSGRNALAEIKANPRIGLLVTDLKMPDMDGIALLRQLDSVDRPIDVIIMSALGQKILRAAAAIGIGHDLNILGITEKPVSLSKLRAMLESPPKRRPAAHGSHANDIQQEWIEDALQHDGYYVVAQPEIEARTGKFVGVELLSRWRHEELAKYSPADVILAAEQGPLINELCRNTVKQAGLAWRLWSRAGLRLTISINLSHHNLADASLPDWMPVELSRYSLAPQDIVLEVTETAVPQSGTISLEVAHRLALAGFRLAIDDYGTGHANLQQLQNMPFQQLKLDKSFIDQIEDSFETRTIVESSIQMARNLGIQTVAEGIEQKSQYAALTAMGCDLMQGYLFSPPQEPQALLDWAQRRQDAPTARAAAKSA